MWTAEAEALTENVSTVTEVEVVPQKLTALVPFSREMADDSVNPGAAAIIGDALVRQIQRQIDNRYFGSNVGIPNSPAGLADLVGYQTINIGGPFEDLTWAVEAESLLNQVGATAAAYVASAATVQALASLKKITGTSLQSNETLLRADPTQPTRFQVNGTPLYGVLEGTIPDGTIWGIYNQPPKAFVVTRADPELVTSPWPGFTSDLLYTRLIYWVGFCWPHPASVIKITGTLPGGS